MVHQLFSTEFKNPNQCPILSTIFINHENTNYCSVNRLWAEGHEIGLGGLIPRNQDFWQTAASDVWFEEISKQMEILDEEADINAYTLGGWRSPWFQPGGDAQFTTMNLDFFFKYDSTLPLPPIRPNAKNKSSYWPFTLDLPYTSTFPCAQLPCPQKSHPALWELATAPLWDGVANRSCLSLGACLSLLTFPDNIYNMLHTNFHRHFTTNRSPFIINVSARWLLDHEEVTKGLENFLFDMVKDENVWIVTGSQAISWMKNPVPLDNLADFTPWGCVPRRYKPKCAPKRKSERKVGLFKGFIFGGYNTIVFLQYLAFVISFLMLRCYDKRRLNALY